MDNVYTEYLAKSKKDLLNMYGPGITADQKDHVQWATSKLPNENWSLWVTRAHKSNPAQFTPEIKEKIEHFAGSQHIPEVAKVRFEKTHDLNSGLKILENAEKQYNDRIGSQLNVVKPDANTKKIMDVGNGMAWYSLGRGSCSAEGKAMGHCGNVPSEKPGDRVLSLRTEHKGTGSEIVHEPHATFIINGGYLGEMKGRANTKPSEKYHKAIADLLLHPKVKGIVGGGYAHHQNFSIHDLTPEQRARVLAAKPNINVYESDTTPSDLPEKFNKEVEPVIDFKNKLKNKDQNGSQSSLRDQIVAHIAAGTAPQMALNLLKDPSDNEIHHIVSSDKASTDSRVQAAMAAKDSARIHAALANAHPDDIDYLNSPNIDAIIGTKNHKAIEKLAGNRSLSEKHLDKIMAHPYLNDFPKEALVNLANNDKLNPKHHASLINSPHSGVREVLAQADNLDPQFHNQLVNDPSDEVRDRAMRRLPLSKEHQEKILNDGNITHISSLSQNKHLDPEVGSKLAESVSKMLNNPETANSEALHQIKDNLLDNDALSPDALAHLSSIKNDRMRTRIYHHDNISKELFDQMFNRDTQNPEDTSTFGIDMLNHKHLSPDQFKQLKAKLGRRKEFSGEFKIHPFYEAKTAEITPEASSRMLANHINKFKEKNPKKYNAVQDKLINEAIASGSLKPVSNLIETGALDDAHHKKLHDELEAVDYGDHEHSSKQKWNNNHYNEIILNHLLESENLPQSHYDELFHRLEHANDLKDSPEEVRDLVFDKHKDSQGMMEEIYEKAEHLAQEDNPMSEYLDDQERYFRNQHPLDYHVDKARSQRRDVNLSGLQALVEEKALETLKVNGQIDQDGNYSDKAYDSAIDEAKDVVHAQLRDYLENGNDSGFPTYLHQPLERYREQLDDDYRDYISDQAYENHRDDAEDEIKDKMMIDKKYWPKHLQETDWVKNNIRPEDDVSDSNIDEFGVAKTESPAYWGRPNITPNITLAADILLKSAITNKSKLAIAQTLANIQAQADVIEQYKEQDPNTYKAITDLTQVLVELFKELTQEPIEAAMHQLEIQNSMQPESPEEAPQQSEAPPSSHIPPQDKPITHNIHHEYPVGSIRDYQGTTGNVMQKLPDGQWISVKSGVKKDPSQ